MKYILFVVFALLNSYSNYAQKTELSANVFKGAIANKDNNFTLVNCADMRTRIFYNAKNSTTWGLQLQAKKISKKQFIYGAILGFSTFSINQNSTPAYSMYMNSIMPGGCDVQSTYSERMVIIKNITGQLFMGYRFNFNRLKIDAAIGKEANHILKTNEKTIESNSSHYLKTESTVNKSRIYSEVKTFFQVTIHYKKFNVFGNYIQSNIGGNKNANLFRFGVGYTF